MARNLALKPAIWSRRTFYDPFKNSLAICPFRPNAVSKTNFILPGSLKVILRNAKADSTKEMFVAARNLHAILSYDGTEPVTVFSQTKGILKIQPTKGYHRCTVHYDDSIDFSLNMQNLQELQTFVHASIPWLYGFQYLHPMEEGERLDTRMRIGHTFDRKNKGKMLALVFNPCRLKAHMDKYIGIWHGAILIRFLEQQDYISVPISMEEVARICSHDFNIHGPTLYFSNSFSHRIQNCAITFNRKENWYFVRAVEEQKSICFRLDHLEFMHMRILFKAALPYISGFDHTLNHI